MRSFTIIFFVVLVFVIVIFLSSCSTIQPIAQDVCRIAEDVCYYQNELCAMVNDTTFARSQIDSVTVLLAEKQNELIVALKTAR